MRIVYLQGINMKAIPKVLVFIILAGTIAQGVFSLRVGFHERRLSKCVLGSNQPLVGYIILVVFIYCLGLRSEWLVPLY